MDHDSYIGKLNNEETESLFRTVLVYLDNEQMGRILGEELDSGDLEEVARRANRTQQQEP